LSCDQAITASRYYKPRYLLCNSVRLSVCPSYLVLYPNSETHHLVAALFCFSQIKRPGEIPMDHDHPRRKSSSKTLNRGGV